MAEGINITLVQSDIIWEDTSANLEMYSSILKDMSESTDIVVLPEMCNTGFTMTPERVAETMDGSTISWMKAMAEQYSTLICGSVVIKEDQYYNRFVAVEPSGDRLPPTHPAMSFKSSARCKPLPSGRR